MPVIFAEIRLTGWSKEYNLDVIIYFDLKKATVQMLQDKILLGTGIRIIEQSLSYVYLVCSGKTNKIFNFLLINLSSRLIFIFYVLNAARIQFVEIFLLQKYFEIM